MNKLKWIILLLVISPFSCVKENDNPIKQGHKNALQQFENILLETQPKLSSNLDIQQLYMSNNTKTAKAFKLQNKAKTLEILAPLVKGSKNVLASYGIDNSELTGVFTDAYDPRIALVSLLLLSADKKRKQEDLTAMNYAGLFLIPSATIAMEPDWYDCALRSIGVDALIELFNGKITKAILIKVIRKIASRTIGWIGAAIAVYEFGDCMEWY